MASLHSSSHDVPTSKSEEQYLVADVFLEALVDAGIDYLFTVLGSDHPSIIEAYIRRQHAAKEFPKMLLSLHEMVALSAADGFARITQKAQCVIVHVDVGTSALGQGLHNAPSGKAPVLIFAGQAPHTLYGEAVGSRSEHVQWYQDAPAQASIVAPYTRYSNEIKSGEHVRMMVNRALLMASTGSCGPAYLTATREVLAARATPQPGHQYRERVPSCRIGGLADADIQLVGEALLFAESPLVVTGYLGRSHAAVRNLVRLTELVGGLRVFDFEFREMSFPANHRACVTRATGGAPAVKSADVILVLDADVPWIPTKVRPSPSARIFLVDIDPRKEKMQLFDIFAEASFDAECNIVLQQLHDYVSSSEQLNKRQHIFQQRWDHLGGTQAKGLETLNLRAQPRADGSISNNDLFATLRRLLPADTIYVNDVVTNQVPLSEQLQLTAPGTNITKGGSGLGWAGGAAIGARLALDLYDVSNRPDVRALNRSAVRCKQSRLVCCLTGDGSFVFGAPSAIYWAQHRLETPFLSVVINNGGWRATRSCIDDVHPGGLASAVSDEGLGIDLRMYGPDYVGISVAASNGTLWARKVDGMAELDAAISEATAVVQEEKRGALLEVVIS